MNDKAIKRLSSYKVCNPDLDLDIEYEIVTVIDETEVQIRQRIQEGMKNSNKRIEELEVIIDDLDTKIDRLTNHADKYDYIIAVCSGLIAGLVDVFFVGEFSLERGTNWADDKVNSFVKKIGGGDTLEKSVRNLENKYGFVGDKATDAFGGGRQHHLRDFSHHPNVMGLVFSLLTQFTGKVYGTDTNGFFICVDVSDSDLIGKDFTSKLTLGFVNWIYHMVSDMAGSSRTISEGKRGTGLPGPFVSFLKMISALPIFKKLDANGNKEISVWISKLFNGTAFADRDSNGKIISDSVKNFDLRSEIGVGYELGRQAIPVIINECLVRGAYFVRRLVQEIKQSDIHSVSDFIHKINWKKTLPFNNRTIARMVVISSGTMCAVDLIDAGIRSGGDLTSFLLRVNFVGLGRFVLAVGNDVKMGLQRYRTRNEKMQRMSELIFLKNAQVYYAIAEYELSKRQVWILARDVSMCLDRLEEDANKAMQYAIESVSEIGENLYSMTTMAKDIESKNPGLLDTISKTLKY